ncbi:MAG: RsmB/NOP family class I SAM-dependent RNA methyltransferase [Verrucomicrobia bacterium]|nr:RsmB/NOP family class I SAM-dependent RNA methyltransferase [Verrucomicrobiota bacterium]
MTDTEHTLLSVGSPTEILHTQAYRAGLFEVQDLHSQMISPATLAGPGQTVVDLCAGEGGKTLHLACLMQNKGRLFASDTAEWKLDRLRLRARRAGISNLQIVPASESKRWKRMAGQCDAVLVDAPCSGLGSLRRHVDIKWHLTPQQLDQLCMEQDTLLEQAIPLLKPSGVIVYATCSILPIEGEQRIQQFCQKFTDFECQWQQRFHPADHKGDGFYAARLRRRNRTTDNTTSPA